MTTLSLPPSRHLILETLKYQLSLLIFILSDSVFDFQFIYFQGRRIVERCVLRVEHVSAQIEHCFLIYFGCLVIWRWVKEYKAWVIYISID